MIYIYIYIYIYRGGGVVGGGPTGGLGLGWWVGGLCVCVSVWVYPSVHAMCMYIYICILRY